MTHAPEVMFTNIQDAITRFDATLRASLFNNHSAQMDALREELQPHLQRIAAMRHINQSSIPDKTFQESIAFLQTAIDRYAHLETETLVEAGAMSEATPGLQARIYQEDHDIRSKLRGVTSHLFFLKDVCTRLMQVPPHSHGAAL